MNTYTHHELNAILELHQKWLANEDGGVRADFFNADLRRANLREADLRGADLRHAWLCGADLVGANLDGADLNYTNLSGANLCVANLRRADLDGADLRRANLSGANLSDANLHEADLSDANLHEADLSYVAMWSTIGNKRNIKSLCIEKYDIAYTSDILQIGCQRHKIEDWFDFDDSTIYVMDKGALEWWMKWKDYIKTTIEMSPAEATK